MPLPCPGPRVPLAPKAGRWAGVDVWLLEPPVALAGCPAGGAGELGVEPELPELEAPESADEPVPVDAGGM